MPPAVTIAFVRSTQEIATSFCVSEVAKETVQDWTLAVSANTIKYHVRLIVRNTPARSNAWATAGMVRGEEAWLEANDTAIVWRDASVYSTTCHSQTPSAAKPIHTRLNCKSVELVIFAVTKLSPMYVVPLLRYVTRGKLSVRETEEMETVSEVAVIAADPRCTVTPRENSATYHLIVIAGAAVDVARWKRIVVASITWPEIWLNPGLSSLKLAPKVRNACVVTTDEIVTLTVDDPAARVASPLWMFGPCGGPLVDCSAN